MTREKNGDFTQDKTKSTDLFFGDKNSGISEKNLLKTRYSNKKQNLDNNQDIENSLIPIPNPITLYTKGDTIISGKLSGTGQILSNGYTYFKSGTQLNINDENNIKNQLTSKIAIYSKKDIQMGVPEGKENSNILREQIKNILQKLSNEKKEYYSSYDIVSKVLRSEIKKKDIMKDDAEYGVDEDLIEHDKKGEASKNESISLETYMEKYYGFSYRERQDYISNIVSNNVNYIWGKYKLVSSENITIFDYQAPSGFSGTIYTCGDFKTNAINSDLTINGTIVAYGGDPSKDGENGKPGKSGGNIKINGCKNFTLTYNSTDLDNIKRLYYGDSCPINLTCVYYNRL
ncbi:hypothetical protein IJJ97_07295 [bacterium]|nr:hypothetical protein [bacterium]